MKQQQIYCPCCRWKPKTSSEWICVPGCGYVWNTFLTRGLCPSCAKQWQDTTCLSCLKTSPHVHWYHEDPEDELGFEVDELTRVYV